MSLQITHASGKGAGDFFIQRKMKKDFQKWHDRKANIDELGHRPYFHEREIWWCAIGVNIGFEQDGAGEDYLRPVIIFKKFNNDIFWAMPLTHAEKQTRFYFRLTSLDDTISTVILSQIRLIDGKRLSHKLGNMNKNDFTAMTKKFKALLP